MCKLSPLTTEKESLIPSQLLTKMREGNVLAWVGAGLSQSAGYPSWTELISSIANNIGDSSWGDSDIVEWSNNNANFNPEWVAEVLYNSQNHAFKQALEEVFTKTKPLPSLLHALLAVLPFKGYITTNYDTLIENHINKFTDIEVEVFDYKTAIRLLSNNSSNKFVLKIHGDIKKNVDDIILTSSDYYKVMKSDKYNKILSWIFSQHVLICMGYSLRDRDFRTFVEERHHVFGSNCPPIYVFVGNNQTCKNEIECYRKDYNIHLIPVSPEYSFKEIPSTLLSLYCQYHHVDSQISGDEILHLIYKKNELSNMNPIKINTNLELFLEKSRCLLSVFKDEIDVNEFNTICSENGIELSTAHIQLIGKIRTREKIIGVPNLDTNDERIIIARWISANLEVIPTDSNPRYLSTYYKDIIKKYIKTITYLLGYNDSWKELVGEDVIKLKRINEYYKQQGLWKEWMQISNQAVLFVSNSNAIYIELIRSQLWIYFWTRDYDKLKELLEKYPEADTVGGENSYKIKLSYMNPRLLEKLCKELEDCLAKAGGKDYFSNSLLGRTFARRSIFTDDIDEKSMLLNTAEKYLIKALEMAKEVKDLIEISVQHCYLALVQIDLGKVKEARYNLSESKRLDENIMERIPGVAWLRVAEYRLALKENSKEKNILRKKATEAMNNLGMVDSERYIDTEYYY